MNKNIMFLTSFIAISLLAFKGVNDDLPNILKQKFENYVAVKTPDKIFVHTDRDLFYKGETIWFKAYITNSTTRKLSENNEILIVQLFNKLGIPVLEKKFKASSGLVKAQLDLPDSLQGTYLFVAYNQWQLNFGQDHIFKKKIKVEAFQETNINHANDTLDYDFQFFPEGGYIVENIESKVGFKATSSFGIGVDVFGYLIRNGSDTLQTFNSEHAGIGSFIFTPETGNSYKVVVEALDIVKEFSIPDVEQEGVVLTVDNKNVAKVQCKLTVSEKFSDTPFIIGIFQNGELNDEAIKSISNHENVTFQKDGLYPGVAVITVFNEKLVPLAERVIFIDKELNANLSIQNDKELHPRKKHEVSFSLKDKDGKPLSGEFSVSVVPARFNSNKPQANIIEYLLLSSEVKGEIENPGFYFLKNNKTAKVIDNLLLVQGWRPKVSITAGLRQSFYQLIGPADQFIFEENKPRSPITILDTIQYIGPGIIKNYLMPEPRLLVNFLMNPNSSIKFSYNRTRQYIHLISNSTSITPLDIWKLSSTYIQPQTGDQAAIGLFNNMLGNSVETSLELYYKHINNIVDYKDGADIYFNETIEADLLNGKAKSYGLELMVRKNAGRLTGWANYTFSRTFNQVDGDFPESRINNGNPYPSNFDRPHMANISSIYQINKRVALSMNFVYNSGRPVTVPDSKYYFQGILVPNFPERNNYRLPSYHRLDISLTIEPNHRKNKKYEANWSFSIYNLYARDNIYSIFFKSRHLVPESFKLSVIGSAIPTITYNFKIFP
jgi:hypothetical protein